MFFQINKWRRMKKQRKINYKIKRGKVLPYIPLFGNWLKNAGFIAGQSMYIELNPNQIIITNDQYSHIT